MRKAFVKMISVVASVSIVFGILPLCFAAFANAKEPDLPKTANLVISKDGVDTDFGEQYNAIANQTKITLESTVDLSEESAFTFDVYIGDYAAFSEAVKSENQGLRLYFGSNTTTKESFHITKNIASVDFTDQIVNDGWNRISVSKSDFEENSINWTAVRFVFLKFNENTTDGYPVSDSGSLQNKELKLRNICSSLLLPEIGKDFVPIYRDYCSFFMNETFSTVPVEKNDLSLCTQIGMDCKFSDKNTFETLLGSSKVRLVFLSGQTEYTVTFTEMREHSANGWYQVFGKVQTTIEAPVTGFYFDTQGIGSAVSVELVNLYGMDFSKPYEDATYGNMTSDFTANRVTATVPKFYGDFAMGEEKEIAAIEDADYIEFDLFVEDARVFVDSFDKDKAGNDISATLCFKMYNTGLMQSLIFSDVQNTVLQSGWNHCILPVNEALDSGFNKNAAVCEWKLSIAGADGKVSPYAGKYLFLENLCATNKETPVQENGYDTVAVLSGAQKRLDLKETFANSGTGEVKMEDPVDFSDAMFVEFDLYVQNYDAWKKAMAEGGYREIQMRISSNLADSVKDSKTADFASMITKSGWNHLCIPFGNFVKGNTSGTLDVSSIAVYKIYYGGRETGKIDTTGIANGLYISVANLCGTAVGTPSGYTGINSVLSEFGLSAMSGNYGARYGLSLSGAMQSSLDCSKAACVEFDLFVRDYESFKQSFLTDADGKEVGVSLNVGIGRGTSYNESNGYYQWSGVQEFVKQEGWNHITLAIGGQSRSKGKVTVDGTEIPTISEIQCVKIWYGGDAYKKGDYTNLIGDELAVFANFTATEIKNPALPKNVLAKIGSKEADGTFIISERSGALGEKFHYPTGRFYENKLQPIRFKGTVVEFDVYVDDLAALRATEAISTVRKSFLCLMLSSTPAYLWGQYDRPDEKYSAYVSITDKLTRDGWNHIRVGKAEFTNYAQTLDWSNITGWQMRFYNSTNVHPEDNPNPNVFVKICNIVNTGVVSSVPKDGKKKSTPDTSAVYISTADDLGNRYGTWNPTALIYNNPDYKTEGKASVFLDLNYLTEKKDATVYFLFDDTADLRDLKTLKLDFFIDLPSLVDAKQNKAEIVLSNTRKIGTSYAKWNLNIASLKSGWNSLELDIGTLSKFGNFQLNEVKNICFRFTQIHIDPDVFGEIKIGFDQLRYLSKTGNTILKINTEAYDDLNWDMIDDAEESLDLTDTDTEEDDTAEANAGVKNRIKHIQTVEVVEVPDYLTAGIIVGATAAALAVIVILYRTKLFSKLLRKKK